MKKSTIYIWLIVLILSSNCMRYLTNDREKVLLDGIDIDQTLQVAEITMAEDDRWGSILTVWAIRDQVMTTEQTGKISALYFKHIKKLKRKFNIWHLTWAIANIYRLGDAVIKATLQVAYDDAKVRAKNTHRIADKFVNGDKLYLGDAHSGGRHYAKNHLVVPGNPEYLQSIDEYMKKQKKTSKNKGN